MTLIVEFASWVLILLGSFFTLVGAFGLVFACRKYSLVCTQRASPTTRRRLSDPGNVPASRVSGLVTLKLVFLLALFSSLARL